MLIALLALLILLASIYFFVLGLMSSEEPKTSKLAIMEPKSRPTSESYSTASSSIPTPTPTQNTVPQNDTRYDELLRDYLSLLRDHRSLLNEREALRDEIQKIKIDEARMIGKVNKTNTNESRGMQTEYVHVRSRTPMPARRISTPGVSSFVLSPNCSLYDFRQISCGNSPASPSPRHAIPMRSKADPCDPRPLNNSECIPLLGKSYLPTDWWRMFDTDSMRVLMNYSAGELLLLWKSDVEKLSVMIESLAVSRAVILRTMDTLNADSQRREFELNEQMAKSKAMLPKPPTCDAATSEPSIGRSATSSTSSEHSFHLAEFSERPDSSDEESNWIKID